MSSNESFFLSPQAAAVYKHKLIKSYIPVWVGKVGSTSADNRLIVYDAYSGPGRYEDQQPGSPELLVDTAEAMAQRAVYSIFSENDGDYCRRLEHMLTNKGIDNSKYEIRQGPVEKHIEEVLNQAAELPLFVFLDPYGLGIPFDRVIDVLTSRDNPEVHRQLQSKTELLMNFSYEAVRRISGVVRSEKEYTAKKGQIRALNEALGGDWWQDLAREQAEGWVQQVLSGYARRISEKTRYGYITAPVADSISSKPVYELILFTRHTDGLWGMVNSMSLARKEWRAWLTKRAEKESGGQVELRMMTFDDDEDAWIDEISHNIGSILQETTTFVIEKKIELVFGRTLGLARETHIRKALKALHAQDIIEKVPKGKLQRARIDRRQP